MTNEEKRLAMYRQEWHDTIKTVDACDRLLNLDVPRRKGEEEYLQKMIEHANKHKAILKNRIAKLSEAEQAFVTKEEL